MDTATALQARRDVRDFSSRPLSEEHLHVILEACRAAPSSQNWQPWNFVVVIEQSRREELAKVWRGAEHVVRAAAAVALVAPLPTDARQHDRVHYDLGQATMCMMLAATDVGVASAHSGVADSDLAREVLGHPVDHFCPYLISFGYPPDGVTLAPVRRRARRSYDDVVHLDHW